MVVITKVEYLPLSIKVVYWANRINMLDRLQSMSGMACSRAFESNRALVNKIIMTSKTDE